MLLAFAICLLEPLVNVLFCSLPLSELYPINLGWAKCIWMCHSVDILMHIWATVLFIIIQDIWIHHVVYILMHIYWHRRLFCSTILYNTVQVFNFLCDAWPVKFPYLQESEWLSLKKGIILPSPTQKSEVPETRAAHFWKQTCIMCSQVKCKCMQIRTY